MIFGAPRQSGDTLGLKMEEAAPTSASAGRPPASAAPKPSAQQARCVLLSAQEPPPDLGRALSHKGIATSRGASPEVALAMVVRAHRDAVRAGTRAPIIFVAVEPDALGDRGTHLLRCIELYAPHAVCWRFDQTRSPQLSAWKPAPVKPVVVPQPARPAPRPAGQGAGEPRLRLVGDQTFRAPPAPPAAALFVGPGIPLAAPPRRRPESGGQAASGGQSEAETPPPPVSDAELSMLLSGKKKNDPKDPRRT